MIPAEAVEAAAKALKDISLDWEIIDTRTGARFGLGRYPSEPFAQQTLEHWRARDRKGKRQDISHYMPHLAVRRIPNGDD